MKCFVAVAMTAVLPASATTVADVSGVQEVRATGELSSVIEPIATVRLEGRMKELRGHRTIAIDAHGIGLLAHVSDGIGGMGLGRLIEYRGTNSMFTGRQAQRIQDHITGRFG